MKRKTKEFRYRSAKTGRFIKKTFAIFNPFTTVRERIKKQSDGD